MLDIMMGISLIMVMTNTLIMPMHVFNIQTEPTLVGITGLNIKWMAINQQSKQTITIHNQVLNQQYNVPFEDCELVITENGNASASGTCKSNGESFTLRPGEGGFGYPW